MSKEPHLTQPTRGRSYALKADVKGEMVLIADSQRDDRGMELIIQKSRALIKHHLHELVVTTEPEAAPGRVVNSVAYIGLMEITSGGAVVVGDEVFINDVKVGHVAGFDETHFPNHINILVRVEKLATGLQMGLTLGSRVRISLPPERV